MYTLSMPISTIRTKIRQEYERHRYVNQLKTVDVLLFNSHQEFQVRLDSLLFLPVDTRGRSVGEKKKTKRRGREQKIGGDSKASKENEGMMHNTGNNLGRERQADQS